MSIGAPLVNGAWTAAQVPAYLRFVSAMQHLRAEQEGLLFRYLKRNAHTDFGRRHGFNSIRSVAAYQQRVPLSTYEDYEPAIERIRAGARDVLSAGAVRKLEPSSGSTRAAKLIPYTAELQAEFRRAVAPWIVDLTRTYPSVLGGPAYWSITPAIRDQPAIAQEQTAVGFETDSAYLGGWLRWLADRTLVACDDLRHVDDVREFRRLTLLRLLNAGDLRTVSVWHPSFLLLLLDELRVAWSELLRSLHDGVRPCGRIRGSPRNALRARKLASADPFRPLTIWPKLALVSCWGDGHAATLLPALRERLPGVCIQPKGLIATEAFVSLPFAGHQPLAVRSHFFEFLEERGEARAAWELERARTYSVVVTTGGGLYRYRLCDRIEVRDFIGQTPCIGFVGKEDSVSDLCGEKLSEGFVATTMARILPALAPRARFALLAPEEEGGAPRYVLFIESPEAPAPALRDRLEAELARNPNYAHCVRLGQLRPAAVARVDANAGERYLARLHGSGQRLGNIKPAALSSLSGWRETFCAPSSCAAGKGP